MQAMNLLVLAVAVRRLSSRSFKDFTLSDGMNRADIWTQGLTRGTPELPLPFKT